MSSNDRFTFALVTQLAQVADGAILGVGLAFVAVRSIVDCIRASSALKKIRDAPSASVSDLRSILSQQTDNSSGGKGGAGGEVLVVVRGTVDAVNVLLSSNTKENAVVLQKTQSCIYNGFIGFMPWASDIPSILTRAWREERSYTRTVPFVLKQGAQQSKSDYLVVNLEGSKHPLPLITVSHVMQPITATPYTLMQAIFGREYAVGLLDEEKILPPGKEITAVGVCYLKDDGVPEIKSCNNLPYFLSVMGKKEMVVDLSFRMKMLMWSSIVIGSISLGILGYAVTRNWNRWKERQQRAMRIEEEAREVEILVQDEDEEEEDEIPEGQLCVLCIRRRRESAFVPCGHLVCCRRCALLVERETEPKCPVCRQSFRSSVRIYAS